MSHKFNPPVISFTLGRSIRIHRLARPESLSSEPAGIDTHSDKRLLYGIGPLLRQPHVSIGTAIAVRMSVDLELQIGMSLHQCRDLSQRARRLWPDGRLIHVEQDAMGNDLPFGDDLFIFVIASLSYTNIPDEQTVFPVTVDGQMTCALWHRVRGGETVLVDIYFSKRLVQIDRDMMPDSGYGKRSLQRCRHGIRRLARPPIAVVGGKPEGIFRIAVVVLILRRVKRYEEVHHRFKF